MAGRKPKPTQFVYQVTQLPRAPGFKTEELSHRETKCSTSHGLGGSTSCRFCSIVSTARQHCSVEQWIDKKLRSKRAQVHTDPWLESRSPWTWKEAHLTPFCLLQFVLQFLEGSWAVVMQRGVLNKPIISYHTNIIWKNNVFENKTKFSECSDTVFILLIFLMPGWISFLFISESHICSCVPSVATSHISVLWEAPHELMRKWEQSGRWHLV